MLLPRNPVLAGPISLEWLSWFELNLILGNSLGRIESSFYPSANPIGKQLGLDDDACLFFVWCRFIIAGVESEVSEVAELPFHVNSRAICKVGWYRLLKSSRSSNQSQLSVVALRKRRRKTSPSPHVQPFWEARIVNWIMFSVPLSW